MVSVVGRGAGVGSGCFDSSTRSIVEGALEATTGSDCLGGSSVAGAGAIVTEVRAGAGAASVSFTTDSGAVSVDGGVGSLLISGASDNV